MNDTLNNKSFCTIQRQLKKVLLSDTYGQPRHLDICVLLWLPFIFGFNPTRGVHLIVSLGFCKVHYETYPHFIYFNRLVRSPLTEMQFLVLEPRL